MQKQKLSLGAFMKSISQAVSEANQKLAGDYAQSAVAPQAEAAYLPGPLCISRMRVSFSAHMTRSDRILQENGTAELMLDFEKKGANFHGELVFLPLEQETPWDWDNENTDDNKKVTIRSLGQTGGFENGNR